MVTYSEVNNNRNLLLVGGGVGKGELYCRSPGGIIVEGIGINAVGGVDDVGKMNGARTAAVGVYLSSRVVLEKEGVELAVDIFFKRYPVAQYPKRLLRKVGKEKDEFRKLTACLGAKRLGAIEDAADGDASHAINPHTAVGRWQNSPGFAQYR